MAYKVNRIGTPQFYEEKTLSAWPTSFAAAAAMASDVLPVLVANGAGVSSAYGTAGVYGSGLANFPANSILAVGQWMRFNPNESNANAMVVEVSGSFMGLLPGASTIVPVFGTLSAKPTTTMEAENAAHYKVIGNADRQTGTTDIIRARMYNKVIVVTADDWDADYFHGFLIGYDGDAAVPNCAIETIDFSMRTLDSESILRYYKRIS